MTPLRLVVQTKPYRASAWNKPSQRVSDCNECVEDFQTGVRLHGEHHHRSKKRKHPKTRTQPSKIKLLLTETTCQYIQENNAEHEKPQKSLFNSRIEIKPLSKELKLIDKGFRPERESLAED